VPPRHPATPVPAPHGITSSIPPPSTPSADVTLSEAIIKLPACAGTGGARDDGGARAAAAGYCVNASGLYAASRQNAFVAPPAGVVEGRVCLQEYATLGYVPSDVCDQSVTRSVNYWHSDWSLARAAEALGATDDAKLLDARAANFTTLLE
jgi:putative alpha-1,2-mannosidase